MLNILFDQSCQTYYIRIWNIYFSYVSNILISELDLFLVLSMFLLTRAKGPWKSIRKSSWIWGFQLMMRILGLLDLNFLTLACLFPFALLSCRAFVLAYALCCELILTRSLLPWFLKFCKLLLLSMWLFYSRKTCVVEESIKIRVHNFYWFEFWDLLRTHVL